ncbi:unnamed protein product, partial [Citrullus colocynthis]
PPPSPLSSSFSPLCLFVLSSLPPVRPRPSFHPREVIHHLLKLGEVFLSLAISLPARLASSCGSCHRRGFRSFCPP